MGWKTNSKTSSSGTGDYTANDVLDKIKTVDGPDSGLDADTLDGKQASEFATSEQGTKADNALPASNYTANDVLDKIKTVDGPDSGLDADTLDGKQASEFALANHTHETMNEVLPTYFSDDVKTINLETMNILQYGDFCFGFMADIHGYVNHIKGMIEMAKNGQINCIVIGGDMNSSESSMSTTRQNLMNCVKILQEAKVPVLICRGNHDSDSNSIMTPSDWWNIAIRQFNKNFVFNASEKEGGYFYVDFDEYKIRIIVTNSASIPYTDLTYKSVTQYRWGWAESQLNWIGNVALNMTGKEDYSVLVFGHHCTRQIYTAAQVARNSVILEQVLKSFKEGLSYSSGTVNVDFTSKGAGKLVGYFFGHTHYDIWDIPEDLNYPMISVLSSIPDYYSSVPSSETLSYPRTIGTATEYAFDVFVLNHDTKYIYANRCGAGVNRNMQYSVVSDNIEDYIVYDSFNRADGQLSVTETGQNYISYNDAVFKVVSNSVDKSPAGTSGYDMCVVDSGLANCTIELDVLWQPFAGNKLGIAFRDSDSNNFFNFSMDINGYYLERYLTGTYSLLGSFTSSNQTITSYKLKVVLNGSTIDCYVNGTLVLSKTNTHNQTATKHGLRYSNRTSAGTPARLDNLKIKA